MQEISALVQRHSVFFLRGGTLHYLPTSPRRNVQFFFFREGGKGRKKKKLRKNSSFIFFKSQFFFPEKKLQRPTSKKLSVFFPRFRFRKKKTRSTYLSSQKSTQKQCAIPEIKKLSAFGCRTCSKLNCYTSSLCKTKVLWV